MPYMVERARENAKRAREGLDFAYPLPADRNIEASVAMIDGPQSVVSYEAENRVHGHKAMMAITRS